jgi:glutamate/tyrosine decarboxylase-like PLP-dependent enzyme
MAVPRPEPVEDLDWDEERARGFADGVAGIWIDVLGQVRTRTLPIAPSWSAKEVQEAVAIDVPNEPMGDEEVLAYLRRLSLGYSSFLGHPGFMAYISGSGTAPGAAADLLAAGLNMNVGGWGLAPWATELELHLCRWFAREVFGLPETAGGTITSGGAMANFIGLKAARDRQAGFDVRNDGISAGPPLGVYLSTQTHTVSLRAADMLGIGWNNVRRLPARADYRFDVDALREAIARDRADGVRPISVIGSAGTVLTGVVDPLDELADVCADEGLWFHVDGAYGGPAMLADDLRPLFAGIERADSIAFDPHKWLYTPHSGGCVLVRDLQHLRDAFDVAHVAYIHQEDAYLEEKIDLGRLGPHFSRSFWALKVWVSLLAHGRGAYGRRISHDAELARYLGARVKDRDDFELCAPVGLSITCFRYVPPTLPDGAGRAAYLNELNRALVTAVQGDGRVFLSNAELDGDVFALRTCIVNHRTESEDIDAVLEVTARHGRELDDRMRPEGLR